MMAARKALSKKVRFDVFKRDAFTCQYCGAHPPAAILHVDHIHPVAEGGSNDCDNLVTSCDACNLGKGARLLSDVPSSLSDRAVLVAEREEQIRGYNAVMEAKRLRLDEDAWRVADVFVAQFIDDGIRKDWFQSILRFIEKLGVHDVLSAMEIAVSRKPWSKNNCFKYFCGVCWGKIREGGQ